MTDTTMPDGSAAQQVIDRTVTEVAPEEVALPEDHHHDGDPDAAVSVR